MNNKVDPRDGPTEVDASLEAVNAKTKFIETGDQNCTSFD